MICLISRSFFLKIMKRNLFCQSNSLPIFLPLDGGDHSPHPLPIDGGGWVEFGILMRKNKRQGHFWLCLWFLTIKYRFLFLRFSPIKRAVISFYFSTYTLELQISILYIFLTRTHILKKLGQQKTRLTQLQTFPSHFTPIIFIFS